MRPNIGAPFLRALAVGLALSVASAAIAQTDVTTSRISGIVKDAEGGALPGVSVEGKNQETGLTANATTDSEGLYRLLNLPTGTYTITVDPRQKNTGSLTFSLDSVPENTGETAIGTAPTVNFTLQLAGVTASVTVTDEIPLVEVTNTSSSTTIQTEEIEALPISGRDFKNLVLLTPQVRLESERGTLAISGERGINTSIMVDGVDYNNAMFGGQVGGAEGRAPLSISQESIKEFTVITNGASAEFGRTAGGVVNRSYP